MQEVTIRNGKPVQAGADDTGEFIRDLKHAAERSLYVFARLLGWTALKPGLHDVCAKFIQTIPPRMKLILMPRGTFKTTLAMSLGVHMTIQPMEHNIYFPGLPGADTRILYAAETADRAETRLSYIKHVYDSNQLLRALWPDIMWDNPQAQKARWNQQRLQVRRSSQFPEATFERTGVDTAITGGHFDALIKDDLISIDARNSEAVMRNAIFWDKASHALRNNPMTAIEWYFGTRWGSWDLYTELEKELPPEAVYVRQAVENGVVVFPERLPMSELESLKARDEDLFFLNYMNTTSGSKMQDFDMKLIRNFTIEEGKWAEFVDIEEDAVQGAFGRLEVVDKDGKRKPALYGADEEEAGKTLLTAKNYRVLRGSAGTGLILKFT